MFGTIFKCSLFLQSLADKAQFIYFCLTASYNNYVLDLFTVLYHLPLLSFNHLSLFHMTGSVLPDPSPARIQYSLADAILTIDSKFSFPLETSIVKTQIMFLGMFPVVFAGGYVFLILKQS